VSPQPRPVPEFVSNAKRLGRSAGAFDMIAPTPRLLAQRWLRMMLPSGTWNRKRPCKCVGPALRDVPVTDFASRSNWSS
jgi:hypothetical protein